MSVSVKKRPKRAKKVKPIFSISVRGDSYNVFLHSEKEICFLVNDSQAFMNFEEKEIHFSKENLTLTTITHEIIHCFIASTYIHEISHIDMGDFEEIVCEVVSRNYREIGDLAKKVKKDLKKALKEKEIK